MIQDGHILAAVLLYLAVNGRAQDSVVFKPNILSIKGYVESYYTYDFNKPPDHNRPFFLYSYNRHNEFNVNLAFIKSSLNTENLRANFALAAGTYMNANYASETGVLKNIFEANVGIKLTKNNSLWLDFGILPSHIGFESAIGADCWTLSRSIVAENSPYYESGAKLSYTTTSEKLTVAAFALNGWQRITRVPGNSLMSWGSQVFISGAKVKFNYSTFFGTDKPDSVRLWRIYHNLYAIIQLSNRVGLIAGFDVGTEQKVKGSNDKNIWYAPVAILKLTPTAHWAIAVRGEYYVDMNGVILKTGTANGFKTHGLSFNIDKSIGQYLLCRLEFRMFKSKDEIFLKENEMTNTNSAISASLAVSF